MIKRFLIAGAILSVVTPHLQAGGIRFKSEDILFAFIAAYALFVPGVVRFRSVPVLLLAPFGAVCASTISACISGYYDEIITPALTAMKWFEYGFIFVIAYCLNFKEDDFHALFRGIAISAAAFSLFGLIQGGSPRAYDEFPFVGESNHIGFICALGVLLAVNEGRALYYAAAAAAGIGLMLSASRSATIALGSGLISYFLFTRRKVAVALLAGIAATFLVWPLAVERLISGIHAEVSLYGKNVERESVGQPRLIGSVNRIQNADIAVCEAASAPVLGLGPGVRHRIFYENQYAMWIGENGMLGFIAFTLLIVAAYFSARRGSPATASAIVMYLVFALFCESFFVSRLAPFAWLIAGSALHDGADVLLPVKHGEAGQPR